MKKQQKPAFNFILLPEFKNDLEENNDIHGILQARILEWASMSGFLQGTLLDPGIAPTSPTSPALAGGFFTTSTIWEAQSFHNMCSQVIMVYTLNFIPRSMSITFQ